MQHYQKQKPQKKDHSALLIFVSMVIAGVALIYAQGQHQQANMALYAQQNNCEWQYNGTYYWDDRDYTCK